MTATMTDEVTAEFEAALARDASKSPRPGAQEEAPPPPRRDPAAPHGREDDGTPKAPYGVKADGTPRMKPAGPGRPAAQPHVTTQAAGPDAGKGSGQPEDFVADLQVLADSAWIGLSALRGGKVLGILPLPDTRPYAAVWHMAAPQQVAAWNQAAKQNATVRDYVRKFSGDGSMAWVIGVGVATMGLLGAVTEMAKSPPEVKAAVAAANEAAIQAHLEAQMEAMGLEAAA